MATVKISSSGQVRIPKEVLERLRIASGDYLDFEFIDDKLVVKAKKLIDADQALFWTKEWQESEKAASEDIKKGRVSQTFSSAEEGISHLRKKRKEIRAGKKGR
jgi:AbrB family looped-hinge helix DNA binding protein